MRGTFSYITLLVINPIIILFYQNCSVVPARSAHNSESFKPPVQQQEPLRTSANVGSPGFSVKK